VSGTIYPGQTVTITTTFTKAVTVTGSPRLKLETGVTDEYATYVSGSGTKDLVFVYTHSNGKTSSDLNYFSTSALELNGGTVTYGAGNVSLPVILPALTSINSLASNSAIVLADALPQSGGGGGGGGGGSIKPLTPKINSVLVLKIPGRIETLNRSDLKPLLSVNDDGSPNDERNCMETFTTNLTPKTKPKGSRTYVYKIQVLMNKLGYTVPTDGIYTSKLTKAIKKFQEANTKEILVAAEVEPNTKGKIQGTGNWKEVTRNYANTRICELYPEQNPIKNNKSALQSKLLKKGKLVSSIDR
jgi:hypothetical protein